jgi:hypothetical protein
MEAVMNGEIEIPQERPSKRMIDKGMLTVIALQTVAFSFWLGGIAKDVASQGKTLEAVVIRANDLNKVDVQLAEIRLQLQYVQSELSRTQQRVSSNERNVNAR